MSKARDGGKLTSCVTIQLFGFFGMILTSSASTMNATAYGNLSHFVLSSDATTQLSIEKVERAGKITGFKLVAKNFAPKAMLSSFKDERTSSLKTSFDATSQTTTLMIELSPEAILNGIEYFDYRTKNDGEIVFDYWLKAGAVTEKKTASKNVSKVSKPVFIKKNILGTKSLSNLACANPLDLAQDGKIEFKTYHRNYSYRDYFKLKSPDAGYDYTKILEKNEFKDKDEKSYYLVINKLAREKNYALSLRSMELFKKKFPKSVLNPELRYLKATVFYELSKQLKSEFYLNEAVEILRSVVLEDPKTDKAKLAQDFLIQEVIEKYEGVAPYQILEITIGAAERGEGDSNPLKRSVYRMAAAESLQQLGEFDRARENYTKIIEEKNSISPAAAMRMGELDLQEKHFDQAVFTFEESIKNNYEYASKFSPIWFNLAEAYYTLGNYKESEKYHRKFIELFRNDANAWASRYRLAEINHIQGSASNANTIVSSYEDVVNSSPYTPGSVLAELRLSDCYTLKKPDVKKDFFVDFFKSISVPDLEKTIINQANLKEVFDLYLVRFYSKAGEYEKVLQAYENSKNNQLKQKTLNESFEKIYSVAAEQIVIQKSNERDSEGAVLFADRYSSLVNKNPSFDYHYSLAKSFAANGSFEKALKEFEKTEAKLIGVELAKKDKYFLDYANTLVQLGKSIEEVSLKVNRASDDYFFSKNDLLAKLYFSRKDYKNAFEFNDKILRKDSLKLTPAQEFEISLRKLESASTFFDSRELASLADQIFMKFGALTEKRQMQLRLQEIRAQSLYDSKVFSDAVEAIDSVLKMSPEHPRKKEFEFMKGKALALIGRETEALAAFRQLANDGENDVWKKSAQAELEQLDWEKSVSGKINNKKDRRSLQ